jgi:hypothetical protein
MQQPLTHTKKINHKKKLPIYLKNKKRALKKSLLHQPNIAVRSMLVNNLSSDLHIITKTEAITMIDRFTTMKSTSLMDIQFTYGKQYDRSIFEAMLAIEGCSEIRIINALTEANEQTFVLMPVKEVETPLYLTKIITDENGEKIPVDALADMGNNCQGGNAKSTAYRI